MSSPPRAHPDAAPPGERDDPALFRLLVEQSLDMVVVLDAAGVARFASPSHRAVLGFAPDEIVGTNPLRLVHPGDAPRVAGHFGDALAEPGWQGRFEFRIATKEGGWRIVEAVGHNLLHDPGVRGIVVTSRDVSEKRRAERRSALLLDVAQEVSGAVDVETILDRVLERVVAALPCDMAGAYLFDREREVWHLAAQHGLPDNLAALLSGMTFPPGKPFDGQVAGGATIVVNDVREQPWITPEVCAMVQLDRFVASSLRVGDRHLGLLIFARGSGSAAFDMLVRRIDRSARELLGLIENTLDLSRLEASRMTVELEPVAPADLLRTIAREAAGRWEKPAVQLQLRFPDTLPMLRTDRRKLEIIVKNLVANAAKFTEHGSVALEAGAHGDRLWIAVVDTGCGIDRASHGAIFDAFVQGVPEAGQSQGGVGLGLYIVKRLVGLLGGEVSVESRLGYGSRFEVELPLH